MDTRVLRRIQPTSLSEQAAGILRDAIMGGSLPPGARLNERAIARQMGISRVPVREAIRQLEHEGLVVSTHNRGSYVRDLDQEDVEEIFELRAVLEGLACQMIVQGDKLDASDFELLQHCVEKQQEAIATGDYGGWIESEIEFHTFICQKAGSKRLFEMWQNLHVQSLFATHENWEAYLHAYGSHPVILDALRREDPGQLIPLHQEVYANVRESALGAIRAKKDKSVPSRRLEGHVG